MIHLRYQISEPSGDSFQPTLGGKGLASHSSLSHRNSSATGKGSLALSLYNPALIPGRFLCVSLVYMKPIDKAGVVIAFGDSSTSSLTGICVHSNQYLQGQDGSPINPQVVQSDVAFTMSSIIHPALLGLFRQYPFYHCAPVIGHCYHSALLRFPWVCPLTCTLTSASTPGLSYLWKSLLSFLPHPWIPCRLLKLHVLSHA